MRLEKIKKETKAFAILPLILGIIFVLLLGGVGLEIVQTKQKISQTISEVQNLQKEKKYEEAIQKLEQIENNFLVKYFGFEKDKIDKVIEENRILIKEAQQKQVKEETEKMEEVTQEAQPQILDCKDSLDCLIGAAKNCNLAKMRDRISLKFGSWEADVLFSAEIKGKENEKCVFYVEAEKLFSIKKEGMTEEEIEKETEKWQPYVEGAKEICLFKNEDLVNWLQIVKEGILPSFEGAECKYHGLEIQKIFQ
jgi:hypothetical protein